MTARYFGALRALCSIVFVSLCLSACNGSSGENGPEPFNQNPATPTPEYTLSINVLDSSCSAASSPSVELGTQVCVEASLMLNSAPAVGEIVSFSTDIGELSVTSKLTDSAGIAQVLIDSTNANLGAGAINALFNNVNSSVNIEFIASGEQQTQTFDLQLNLSDAQGNLINRFSNAQNINVNALLTNENGIALSNEIVTFQTSNGELTITDALTNSEGLASTQIITEAATIGAANISATIEIANAVVSDSSNFEVFADAQVQDVVRIGHIENGIFVENQLGVNGFAQDQDVVISAGATLGVYVDLVDSNDQLISNNIPVTFSSNCAQQDAGTIDQNVVSIGGRANSTYEDISCASGNGNQDVIQASVFVDGNELSVSRLLTLSPESAGAIGFISATPSNIVLQGTGGQGSESVSLVSFEVTGAQGNPLAQQTVNFELNTQAGGLSLSPSTGLTNSQGQVSTRVTAGNVPTSVRVTASLNAENGDLITSQSDLLTVNTGLPDQNSLSLSASDLNPEAFNIDGQTVVITSRLADSFNNPVPDGTAVSFTAEGGLIEPSCITNNGVCSVIWTSSLPRVDDHRVTILATAIGHETLSDSNGNNLYDDTDGTAITSNDGSGFDFTLTNTSGFVDLSEAWRDDNENRIRDSNEVFFDFDSSGSFNAQNGLFDGPQCEASSCGASSIHVRRALVLVTSSSAALISVSTSGTQIASNVSSQPTTPVLSIVRGDSATFEMTYADTAGQAIASGSRINVVANAGELAGTIQDTMPLTNANAARTNVFTLTNSLAANETSIDSTISVTITSPSGVQSSVSFIVRLQ